MTGSRPAQQRLLLEAGVRRTGTQKKNHQNTRDPSTEYSTRVFVFVFVCVFVRVRVRVRVRVCVCVCVNYSVAC